MEGRQTSALLAKQARTPASSTARQQQQPTRTNEHGKILLWTASVRVAEPERTEQVDDTQNRVLDKNPT
jgi:hypothetical protein